MGERKVGEWNGLARKRDHDNAVHGGGFDLADFLP